jgi:hypothetical protein
MNTNRSGNLHEVMHQAAWDSATIDGIPDHHDGHGPYEVRTLYTTPQQRPWVGLTEEEVEHIADSEWEEAFVRLIEAKLKEKNQ